VELEGDRARDVLYLVQSPPPAMIKLASQLSARRIRFLTTPIVEDEEISRSLAHLPQVAEQTGDLCTSS